MNLIDLSILIAHKLPLWQLRIGKNKNPIIKFKAINYGQSMQRATTQN